MQNIYATTTMRCERDLDIQMDDDLRADAEDGYFTSWEAGQLQLRRDVKRLRQEVETAVETLKKTLHDLESAMQKPARPQLRIRGRQDDS